jgi:hypothetical protein
LKGVYNVKHHPKFLNGEMTEDQILRHFLNVFDTKGSEDGTVSYAVVEKIAFCLSG